MRTDARAAQPKCLVGLAFLLLPEGLGVESVGRASDPGQNRQGDQNGYDRLHGPHSICAIRTTPLSTVIAGRRLAREPAPSVPQVTIKSFPRSGGFGSGPCSYSLGPTCESTRSIDPRFAAGACSRLACIRWRGRVGTSPLAPNTRPQRHAERDHHCGRSAIRPGGARDDEEVGPGAVAAADHSSAKQSRSGRSQS